MLEPSGLESNVRVAKSKTEYMVGGMLVSTNVLRPSQTSVSLISN